MKRAFRVFRLRPTVVVQLTRESVAMGDDVDAPHAAEMDVRAVADPVALVQQIYPGYLPSVAGRGHSWEAVLNGRPVARITYDPATAVQPLVQEVEYAEANRMHFRYTSAAY